MAVAPKNKSKTTNRTSTKPTTNRNRNTTNNKKPRPKTKSAIEIEEELIQKSRFRAVMLFIVSIFLICLIFIKGSSVWSFLHNSILGLFGYCSILWPIFLIYLAVLLESQKERKDIKYKVYQVVSLILLITASCYIFTSNEISQTFWEELRILFDDGASAIGSGLFSGLLGMPLVYLLGSVGAKVTVIIIDFALFMLLTGTGVQDMLYALILPIRLIKKFIKYLPVLFAKKEKKLKARQKFANENKPIVTPKEEKSRKNKDINIDVDDEDDEVSMPMHPVTVNSVVSNSEDTGTKQDKIERLRNLINKKKENTQLQEEDSEEEPFVNSSKQTFENVNAINIDEQQETIAPQQTQPTSTTTTPPPTVATSQTKTNNQPNVTMNSSPETLLAVQLAKENILKKEQQQKAIAEQNRQKSTVTRTEQINDDVLRYPPIALLDENEIKLSHNIEQELTKTSEKLIETLKSFGVTASLLDVSRGPAVTRYELKPASGVKISKITNLADDIALNLASAGVRIEAPIPNKPAVGIEVPNEIISIVKMRELIESQQFKNAKSKLTVVLGRDIAGDITIADLAKMPHTLIAGATGSGKSVCINSLIVSLLYKSTSDEVKFLMIDPKVVELGVYNGIPHLLVPVVTEARKAAGALAWAVGEMLKRYRLFADNNVRDLTSYNNMVKTKQVDENGEILSALPQIVIIIDELADLMMAAPNEVEDSICRLAQMARAAGMHLVIATQRPTVDVITGTIKANIPSRIAFAVKSQIDSRTILDGSGAERLLGRGDMLFSPVGSAKPIRVQGCFVTDEEIERVVSYVKEMGCAEYDEEIADEIEKQTVPEKKDKNAFSDNGDNDNDDPMMNEAIKCVVEAGQASTSMLQRRLRLGYARAGRIIDQMAEKGIIGPSEGSKPRQVLINKQQYLEMTMNLPSDNIPIDN